jgi:DNA-binding response OmpR family regulator
MEDSHLIYPDAQSCRAVIIDSNPVTRGLLADMLRQMGLAQITQCGKLLDGRRAIEAKVFDIILCEYNFPNSPAAGQALLDDLRRSQLLPYSTVFIMVTAEATYTSVTEAAEAALDSFLIRPHNANALEERLIQAHNRKKTLADIYEAMERSDLQKAADLCVDRVEKRSFYWLYSARIGAELQLRLGRNDIARKLYEAVEVAKDQPWAKLGIARTEIAEGEFAEAKKILESLIRENSSYADAFDVMGRLQVEQGDLGDALRTYRNASQITPFSITRLQREGTLAFIAGESQEAIQALERAVQSGLNSKLFDCQTLVMLCILHFDKRDSRQFSQAYENLERTLSRTPGSTRLMRFRSVASVFKLLLESRIMEGIALARGMMVDILDERFDFEAATNLLTTVTRLKVTGANLKDGEGWVKTLASRFCVSEGATEMLCQAAAKYEPYVNLIRNGRAEIDDAAEKAINFSTSGAHIVAVKTLMIKGSETCNAQLITLAGKVLQRYADKMDNFETIQMVINDLKNRYCSQGTQVRLGAHGGRAAGGINLRISSSS